MKIRSNDPAAIKAALKKFLPGDLSREIWFFCIGTDRSTGDSYGPIVGTMLKKKGFNVVGTIEDPCHGVNLRERKSEIPEGAFVVAIDASLGTSDLIGLIAVADTPIKPGAGVDKDLGNHGDMSIAGIVNVGGFMEFFVLQNTRLSLVMNLAELSVSAITSVMKGRRIRYAKQQHLEVAAGSC